MSSKTYVILRSDPAEAGQRLEGRRMSMRRTRGLRFVSSWLPFDERDPPAVRQAFQCREARLVGHLRALGDPVAEIDIGQPRATALLDQPEDAPGAEAAAMVGGIVKAVDGRNAVIETIDQRHRDECALRRADLHDRGAHRAVLDHTAVVVVAHRRHVAVAVPRALIGGEQLELLHCRARRQEPPYEGAAVPAIGGPGIEVAHAPGRAGMDEALDGDAHRHAGGARAAGRTVGKTVATPEPGARQLVIKGPGGTAGELDDQLALVAARDIGTGRRGGREKLLERDDESIGRSIALAAPVRPDVHHSPPPVSGQSMPAGAAAGNAIDASRRSGSCDAAPAGPFEHRICGFLTITR